MSTKSRPEARAPSMTSAGSEDDSWRASVSFCEILHQPCIHELQLCPKTPLPVTAPPQERKPARGGTSASRASRM